MLDHVRVSVHSVARATLLLASTCWLTGPQGPHTCYGQPTATQAASPGSNLEAKEQVLRHAVFFKFKASSAKKNRT